MKVNDTRRCPIQISCVKYFYSSGRIKGQENYDSVGRGALEGTVTFAPGFTCPFRRGGQAAQASLMKSKHLQRRLTGCAEDQSQGKCVSSTLLVFLNPHNNPPEMYLTEMH